MKLPRNPKHLFDPGHSGRRFGVSDLPMLREMRGCYRRFLAAADAMRAEPAAPAELLALAVVRADLTAKYEACGRVLSLLERTPAGWRP